jgi:hypothetical protein
MNSVSLVSVVGDISSLIPVSESESESENSGRGGTRIRRGVIWDTYDSP